jgi:hypothetical protein
MNSENTASYWLGGFAYRISLGWELLVLAGANDHHYLSLQSALNRLRLRSQIQLIL